MPASSPRLALLTSLRLATNGAFRFLYPFLPVVAADIGLSTARSGLLLSALALGGVLAPIARRALTGPFERHRGLLTRAGIALVLGTFVAAWSTVAVGVLLGFLLLGIGKPLTDVGALSYVSARVPYAKRAQATSTMELTWAGGLLIVAPIAGIVAGATSWRVPIAGLGVIAGVLVLTARRRLDPDEDHQRSTTTHGGFGVTARWFLVVAFLVFAGLEASFAAFGVWLEDAFGASVEQLGLFAAITATGELVGAASVLAFGDRLGKARMSMSGLVITAVGAALLPFAQTAVQAALSLGVALLGTEIAIVAIIPLASEVAPQARARFLARLVSVGSMARLVMAGAAPAVYSAGGIRMNAAITIVVAIAAAAGLRLIVRREPRLAA